eukprot:TRINITY_DN9287_c0_g1_i1.p1 TRINITY_DN9287_c0_g1~~TRINITY_DN9287_c0_g1_i1.p1  ORF type:complete len:159 (+),score=5.04 TRINITY_DN9287_c0_g1_i1:117-593(+)
MCIRDSYRIISMKFYLIFSLIFSLTLQVQYEQYQNFSKLFVNVQFSSRITFFNMSIEQIFQFFCVNLMILIDILLSWLFDFWKLNSFAYNNINTGIWLWYQQVVRPYQCSQQLILIQEKSQFHKFVSCSITLILSEREDRTHFIACLLYTSPSPRDQA